MTNNAVPNDAIKIYNQAIQLSNRGRYSDALEKYKKAINVFPQFIEAYNNMGEIYSRMGDIVNALSTYQDALKINRNYRVLLNIGVEYFNKKEYETALKFFFESVNAKPDFIEGNYYIGLIYHNKKDHINAEIYLWNVIEIDKAHVKANYLLSYIYYERKDFSSSIKCLESIKGIVEDKSFFNRYYGFCCYYLGRYTEAAEYLTQALKNKSEYSRFKKYLDDLNYEKRLKEIGDVDSAIKDLEGILLSRDYTRCEITKLSMLYIFRGENKRAEELVTSYKNRMAS
jgi:tetratricopeptide (TPR) repeat protein